MSQRTLTAFIRRPISCPEIMKFQFPPQDLIPRSRRASSSTGALGSVLGGNMGVDAIQEFSVLTSNYSAEYGKTSGGVVNAVTRSGTNAFHGSAYEFPRNSALDARNFFEDPTQPKAPFRRNQFGGTIGGPIVKNRTFFFADYEGN